MMCGVETSRILIVEDFEPAREALALFIEGLGFEVDQAKDGQDALQIVRRSRVEYFLLLTDFDMPFLNGIELIEGLVADFPVRVRHFALMSSFPETSPKISPVKSLAVPVFFLSKTSFPGSLERFIEKLRFKAE